jgi:cbb3-type cytochrome oxidase subunit 1
MTYGTGHEDDTIQWWWMHLFIGLCLTCFAMMTAIGIWEYSKKQQVDPPTSYRELDISIEWPGSIWIQEHKEELPIKMVKDEFGTWRVPE